jgi:hypothetical protein
MRGLQRILAIGALLAVVLGVVVPAGASEHGAKLAVIRGTNEWLLRDSLTPGVATTSFKYGRGDDWPLMCDWNGDGVRTPGVVRDRDDGRLVWHLRNVNAGGAADVTFAYGRWDMFDFPICGDWDGDGVQTPGVVRHPDTTGGLRWLLRNRSAGGPADREFTYGRMDHHEDLPWIVVGDWNGNGIDTPGLVWFRDRLLWQLRMVNRGGVADVEFVYGLGDLSPSLDVPVVGDWNGDGRDTIGVARGLTGPLRWHLKNSLRGGAADVAFSYGRGEDWPMVWR